MFVKVINIFDNSAFQRATDSNIVEHREMLHILAQSHPAGMRADGNTEFRRQQQNCQDFVDASNTTCIDLADAERIGLKELLEEDAVLHHLARGDLYWSHCLGDGSMAEHIVWT